MGEMDSRTELRVTSDEPPAIISKGKAEKNNWRAGIPQGLPFVLECSLLNVMLLLTLD